MATTQDQSTQQNQSSQHLTAARTLLDELATTGGDAQTKASMAVAHAVLVLAEQVAVVRVLMAGDAASKRPDLQAAASQPQSSAAAAAQPQSNA
jgi:hypothetical protein